jgi:hypothetical protein
MNVRQARADSDEPARSLLARLFGDFSMEMIARVIEQFEAAAPVSRTIAGRMGYGTDQPSPPFPARAAL